MKKAAFLLCLTLSLFFFVLPGAAQNLQAQTPPELISQAAVVMDAATGTIIFQKNADQEIPPASLTKLMTMHLVFREIAAGRTSLEEIITPPRESWAANQPPRSSLMYLANGHRLSLRELLLGLSIFSGNDAAVAAALHVAPSVDAFAEMMNREAAAMGLTRTRFVEPSGISEFNMTTAGEFARFCRIYLEANPDSLKNFHSVREFAYPETWNLPEPYRSRPGTRVQSNRNTLIGRVEGVDGLKTGYIDESGYNIALTAERDGNRFIAVVLGAPAEWGGDRIRDSEGSELIAWAFNNYKTVRLYPEKIEPARLWKGRDDQIELVWKGETVFTALRERGGNLRWSVELKEPLIAPLPAGSPAGDLVLYDSFGELRRFQIVTAQEAEAGGFFKRLLDSIKLFFLSSVVR